MATTAIWDIKGWLGAVLTYTENPEKTTNPNFHNYQLSEAEIQNMQDVISVAMGDKRTENLQKVLSYTMQPEKTDLKEFVSGINCMPEIARQQMLEVKNQYGKNDGIIAFHGYQSFATGEVTPEIAHEIGIKLAEKLWGERFQVVVTTHLDKSHHIHNHFVLNSVSFIDGRKYNDCKKTYRLMRETSDMLCNEYKLSVIDNSKEKAKRQHYVAWQAQKEGKPSIKTLVQNEVDKTIKEKQNLQWINQPKAKMHKKHYSIKIKR